MLFKYIGIAACNELPTMRGRICGPSQRTPQGPGESTRQAQEIHHWPRHQGTPPDAGHPKWDDGTGQGRGRPARGRQPSRPRRTGGSAHPPRGHHRGHQHRFHGRTVKIYKMWLFTIIIYKGYLDNLAPNYVHINSIPDTYIPSTRSLA